MLRRVTLVALGVILCINGALAQEPPRQDPKGSQSSVDKPPVTKDSVEQPSKAALWKTYHCDQYGFSFEYPAIYDEAPNRENCGVRTVNHHEDDSRLGHIKVEIDLGLRITLDVVEAQRGLSLGAYVNRILKGRDWQVESKRVISVNGVKGYGVDYRFGGGRFGNLTFLQKNGNIFIFQNTAGAECDAPITEWEAYAQMTTTFKFSKGQ